MKINYGEGSEMELTPDNTYILQYPNDILDGVMIDVGDQYAFISAHTEGYRELLDELDGLGVGWYSVEHTDMTEPPHNWVLKSLSSLVVRTAEDLI